MRTVFVRDDKALCEQTTRDLTQLASTLKFGNTAMEAAWIVGTTNHCALLTQHVHGDFMTR